MELKTQNGFVFRPRFSLLSDHTIAHLEVRCRESLAMDKAPCSGKYRLGYLELYPKKEDRHYWSPYISMTFLEEENGKTEIRGLIGPAPEVWTLFVFIYSVLAIAIVIVSVIGLANLSIDESGIILWTLPVLFLLLISSYLISYVGQKKGHDQIEMLYRHFEHHIK